MSKDTLEKLLAEMRDTAEWRWVGYEDTPELGTHDDRLREFADRLEALIKGDSK